MGVGAPVGAFVGKLEGTTVRAVGIGVGGTSEGKSVGANEGEDDLLLLLELLGLALPLFTFFLGLLELALRPPLPPPPLFELALPLFPPLPASWLLLVSFNPRKAFP